jgi:hypothetical protein
VVQGPDVDQGKRLLERAVRSSSAREGSATPLGWLWAKITPAALCASAALTTSRGYTLVCAKVPRKSSRGGDQAVLAVEE